MLLKEGVSNALQNESNNNLVAKDVADVAGVRIVSTCSYEYKIPAGRDRQD